MDTLLMPNIQLVWTFQNFPTPKLTLLEIMFWPQDVAPVDPFVASDFHLLLISKKEENSKKLLSIHFYLFRRGLHETEWSLREHLRPVHGALVQADLKGDYFPLHGSRSYSEKPEGMTLEKEEQLRNNGNLFQEPDSTLLLSSGCGRHWPDARGIFHNNGTFQNFWIIT